MKNEAYAKGLSDARPNPERFTFLANTVFTLMATWSRSDGGNCACRTASRNPIGSAKR